MRKRQRELTILLYSNRTKPSKRLSNINLLQSYNIRRDLSRRKMILILCFVSFLFFLFFLLFVCREVAVVALFCYSFTSLCKVRDYIYIYSTLFIFGQWEQTKSSACMCICYIGVADETSCCFSISQFATLWIHYKLN